jgi:protein-arginine kinase activator protein McsA
MGISKPSIFVGDIFDTKNYGKVEILEYVKSTDITVKFLNTGSIQKTNSSQVKNGILKDKTVRLYGVKVGEVFDTSHCGKCEVVEYIHAKKILVKFYESGKLKWTNSSQLSSGTASDIDPCDRVSLGDIFENTDGFKAEVTALHSGSRFDVRFEDGTVKNVSITALKSGKFLKGTWNYSQDEAIEAMKVVHGDRYDYSLVEFKDVKSKVKVRCYTHGIFQISFDNHVNSAHGAHPSGCRKCAIEARAKAKTLDASLFVEEAIALNGDRYTYNMFDYTTRDKKIQITCNDCGSTFKQSPEKHLGGRGCPSCAKTGFDQTKPGVVYVLSCENLTKIGITNKKAESRAKDISTSYGKDFTVIREFPMSGTLCAALERAMLTYLKKNYERPSTKFNGYSECFLGLRPDDLVEMLECLT